METNYAFLIQSSTPDKLHISYLVLSCWMHYWFHVVILVASETQRNQILPYNATF